MPLSHATHLLARFFNKLMDWSAIGRLSDIAVPVFVINGRDDKVTPWTSEPIFFEVPKVRWVVMDGSSHMPFWEERERFAKLVDDWLRMSYEEEKSSSRY
jgi:pimeloyl-ACP methyl ester carboxylesterase